MTNEIVLGIDLGTSNSCASIWRNQRLEFITDEYGNRTVPSVVSLYKSLRLVGKDAKNMLDVIPQNTFYDVKRLIGLKYDDPLVQNHLSLFSFKIGEKEGNVILHAEKNDDMPEGVKIDYYPEEISAIILTKLKMMAEKYLGCIVSKAVITVPAYFNDSQRQATKDAGQIAGLDVIKIINEPTAAALAHGIEKKYMKKGTRENFIVVYDLGGGTLDVSLLNINNNVFQVLASTGNTHLGGEDFDARIINYAIGEFKKKHIDVDITKLSGISYQKLKKMSENAKKILSTNENAIISVSNFYEEQNLYVSITRDIFEKICNDLFIMCMKPVVDVLKSANVNIAEVCDIVLVGGSTRMPKIKRHLKEYFTDSLDGFKDLINPDEVVSAGAAIHGYTLVNIDDPFSDSIILLDVIPLSLGIETLNEIMTPIIPRNSIIPTKKNAMFSTMEDGQISVTIKVYEGERKLTTDNFLVGIFELSGIKEGPRGYAKIKITFEIDTNGILQVTAHEKNTDAINTIIMSSIRGSKGRLTNEQIDELVSEAKAYELVDKINYEKITYCNEMDDICTNVLDNLKDSSLKLKEDEKIKMKKDVEQILMWLKLHPPASLDKNELKIKLNKLKQNYGPLIMKMCTSTDDTNIKAATNDDSSGVKIHGEEDADTVNEICTTNGEIFKNELDKIKNTLLDLCQSINDLVNAHNPDDFIFLKDYIETVYIWTYTNEDLSINNFINKIDEVNKVSHSVFKDIVSEVVVVDNSVEELKQLCISLKTSINSNFFSLKENDIVKLDETVIDTLIWVKDIQMNDENDISVKLKIKELNEMCNNLYDNMMNIKKIDYVVPLEDTKYSSKYEDAGITITPIKITENLADVLKKMDI